MLSLELLRSMLKEEYRIHTALFNRRFFLLYPVAVTIVAYILVTFASKTGAGHYTLAVIAHIMFFLYGLSVGVFGLHAKDALSIRFDRLSLLIYSSRTLPLSPKTILMTLAVQDIIYYFILTILPIVLGISLTLPSLGISIIYIPIILTTSTLVFLYGLSASFLMTMLYSRYKRLFLFSFALLSYLAFIYNRLWFNTHTMTSILLPLKLLYTYDMYTFLSALLPPIIVILASILLLDEDAGINKKETRNLFDPLLRLAEKLSRKYAPYVAKDMIDMTRSTGGPSKIIFTYLIPAAIVWVMIEIFSSKLFPFNNTLLTYSIIVGVISTGIYNWLNQYDSFANYSIHPVSKKSIIISKTISYAIISSASSLIIICTVAYASGSLNLLPLATLVMFASSFYVLSVLVHIAGLAPNIVLYGVRAFLKYFAYCLPVLVPLTTASFFGAELVWKLMTMMCVVALFASKMILNAALDKHDKDP